MNRLPQKRAAGHMPEIVELRIHGDHSSPTLIYLPGLHGDWTLVGGFRRALAGRLRFVEITYPRTLEWSLEEYAVGVENALDERGIRSGWLLGESFGSQIVWPIVARQRLQTQGIILAGGFVQHPVRWGVRLVEQACGTISLSLLTRLLFAYARIVRPQLGRSPETLAAIGEFIARRTELDRRAAMHRLHLLAQNNPATIVRQLQVPVYGLSGLVDPVVPWFPVRRWLRRHCPALRDYRIIRADHNVLSTAPVEAVAQVLRWMGPPGTV